MQGIHDYIARDSRTYAARFIKSLIKSAQKLQAMLGLVVSYLNLKLMHSEKSFFKTTELFIELKKATRQLKYSA